MTISVRMLAGIATITCAPGCMESSDKTSELVPVLDSRGIVTYRYASTVQPAPMTPIRVNSWPSSHSQFDTVNWQRQQDDRAYQDALREQEAQRRREQQEQQAYQDALRRDREFQRQQEQIYRQQQYQFAEQQRQRYHSQAAQYQRAGQQLDTLLQQMQHHPMP